MNSETKVCQNCKQNFIIETDDFNFYKGLVEPWITKLVDFIKSNLPKSPAATP